MSSSFSALGVCAELVAMLEAEDITKPTPVQSASIPQLLLHHRDVIVEACTGSGKTLSYLLPALEMLQKTFKDRENKPEAVGALVLAPTRELAIQVYKIGKQYSKAVGVGCQLLTSGDKEDRAARLKNPTVVEEGERWDLLIGTPGRLEEWTDKNKPALRTLELLILDEADTLLSLGFQIKIQLIISRLPKQRRTGLFSATQTKQVEDLVRAGMRNPATISVRVNATDAGAAFQKTPTRLANSYCVVEADEKLALLCNFLLSDQAARGKKVICFFATCASVDYFAECVLKQVLSEKRAGGVKVFGLHGKMNAKRRKLTFESFCAESTGGSVLCCTDVVARGIDLPDVDWIVQFDAPKEPDFFVHRCGRTARAGRSGSALLFVLPNEIAFIEYLAAQKVPLAKFDTSPIEAKVSKEEIAAQARELIFADRDVLERGTRAFIAYLAYYAEHRLSYLFQTVELNFPRLLRSFHLLRLPKLKEFRVEKIKQQLGEFEQESNEVVSNISFKNKAKEEKRQKLLEQGRAFNEEQKQKKRKIEKKQKLVEEQPNKRKRKGKQEQIFEEWDELQREEQMYRRMKRKKISPESYDKFLQDEEEDE